MFTFSQLLIRFGMALVLGALIGLERESVGKDAGIRTSMLVAGGSALFTIIGLMLPVLIATSPQNLADLLSHNSGFIMIIANIVVGIGFLGGGIIVKSGEGHVHGLTTAAVVWVTAAIGILSGMGLLKLATSAAIIVTSLLYISRKLGLFEQVRPDGK